MSEPASRSFKNMHWAINHPIYRSAASALIYIAVCTAYIIVSGRIAAGLAKTTEQLQIIETVKGTAFVSVTGIVFFFISLGWWKKTRRQGELLLQSERRAVAAMYSATVVHDLNNLLMSLSVLLEEIGRQEQKNEFSSRLHTNIEHGIQNLTRLSKRITSSARQLQTGGEESVDLYVTLSRAIALVQKHPDVRGCSFDIPDIPHIRLSINTELFEQAVMNLVINAAQAAGSNKKIEITFGKTPKTISLEIHDNGPGVSPDQAEAIFDPGFTTKAGGTGLGLLSVQAFASSCHGKVSMDRSHLGGAVFRLMIPIQTDASINY
ncbi:MAG: hypothetical protein A3J80_10530 [Desulfobacula sp. RIFOXYB2_FULL_45_6]|nr:MAG: hypothetical protein A3J80_10530 [Desulfobacula sp. RIFOXYB2_FULL_45_6]